MASLNSIFLPPFLSSPCVGIISSDKIGKNGKNEKNAKSGVEISIQIVEVIKWFALDKS